MRDRSDLGVGERGEQKCRYFGSRERGASRLMGKRGDAVSVPSAAASMTTRDSALGFPRPRCGNPSATIARKITVSDGTSRLGHRLRRYLAISRVPMFSGALSTRSE
jgi:hypothetical protein